MKGKLVPASLAGFSEVKHGNEATSGMTETDETTNRETV